MFPPPKKNFKWGNFGISGSKSNFQDWRQVKILDPPLVIFSGSFSKFPPATFTPRTRSDRTPRQCPCCLPDVPGVTKATTSNNFKLLGHGMAWWHKVTSKSKPTCLICIEYLITCHQVDVNLASSRKRWIADHLFQFVRLQLQAECTRYLVVQLHWRQRPISAAFDLSAAKSHLQLAKCFLEYALHRVALTSRWVLLFWCFSNDAGTKNVFSNFATTLSFGISNSGVSTLKLSKSCG